MYVLLKVKSRNEGSVEVSFISGVSKCVSALSCLDAWCIEAAENNIAKTKRKTATAEDAQMGRERKLKAAQAKLPSRVRALLY